MSDTSDPFGFGKLVPGFDFLQNLLQSANKAGGRSAGGGGMKLPGLSSWIAPTLDVEELDRRIGELKAVHFWLEQNGKALGATIQAMEVQKMTLATLQGMNLAMGDVAKAFQIKAGAAGGAAAASDAPAHNEGWPLEQNQSRGKSQEKASGNPYAKSFQSNAADDAPRRADAEAVRRNDDDRQPTRDTEQGAQPSPRAGSTANAGMVDPLNWWGALTGQFQQIAANAMQGATANNPALAASREIASSAMKTANQMADNARQRVTRGSGSSTAAKKATAKPAAAGKRGGGASQS